MSENDEATTQQTETSPTVEAETETSHSSETAIEIAEQAESTAEAAEENTYALASYAASLDERISTIERRLENDERRNDPQSDDDGTDSGIGRLDDGSETETSAEDEGRNSRPIIKHWWFGRR